MIIFLIAGILCMAYYIVSLIAGGFSKFTLIWPLMGGIGLAVYFCVNHVKMAGGIIPMWIKYTSGCIGIIFGLCIVIVEAKIIRAGRQKPKSGADYIIILGAQVKGEQPSKALLRRIMTAYAYLKENPQTKAILSGGQGYGEAISEAECMRNVLLAKGIEKNRLILEDKSVNTLENLKFSLLHAGNDCQIVIATCDFHQFRAQAVARKLGVTDVSGIGSGSGHMLRVNDYFREFFAVLKYDISGLI